MRGSLLCEDANEALAHALVPPDGGAVNAATARHRRLAAPAPPLSRLITAVWWEHMDQCTLGAFCRAPGR